MLFPVCILLINLDCPQFDLLIKIRQYHIIKGRFCNTPNKATNKKMAANTMSTKGGNS